MCSRASGQTEQVRDLLYSVTYGLLLILLPTFPIDSSRRLVLASSFYSDLNADCALSACRLEFAPK
jgi:hypothetical protein